MIMEFVYTDEEQYISPTYVTFTTEWDKLAGAASITETFALSSSESLKGELKGNSSTMMALAASLTHIARRV